MTDLIEALAPLITGMAGGCVSGVAMFYFGKWQTLATLHDAISHIGETVGEIYANQAEFAEAVAGQCEGLGKVDRIMLDMLSKHEARLHALEYDCDGLPVGVPHEYEN